VRESWDEVGIRVQAAERRARQAAAVREYAAVTLDTQAELRRQLQRISEQVAALTERVENGGVAAHMMKEQRARENGRRRR
jgi:hypothetical protein